MRCFGLILLSICDDIFSGQGLVLWLVVELFETLLASSEAYLLMNFSSS